MLVLFVFLANSNIGRDPANAAAMCFVLQTNNKCACRVLYVYIDTNIKIVYIFRSSSNNHLKITIILPTDKLNACKKK